MGRAGTAYVFVGHKIVFRFCFLESDRISDSFPVHDSFSAGLAGSQCVRGVFRDSLGSHAAAYGGRQSGMGGRTARAACPDRIT